MKVRITLNVSDDYRKAIRHREGRAGKATRAEVLTHVRIVLGGDEEDLTSDLGRGTEPPP